MPTADGARVADPAFRGGVPSFAEVLDGLPEERGVEGATAADEVRRADPEAAGRWRSTSPTWRTYRTSG